jgi:hypothetical protein
MAGIVAALEAHHDLGALAEPVDDLALALVAPLGADHCHVGHCLFPSDTKTPPGADSGEAWVRIARRQRRAKGKTGAGNERSECGVIEA